MKKLLFVIFLASLSILIQAQILTSPRIYDVKNGLSDNSVRTIIQDGRGYIYLGTKDGIHRLGTGEIKHIKGTSRTGAATTLNTNKLLFHKTEGMMWVATMNGLFLLDLTTEEVTESTTLFGTEDLKGINILDIRYDNDGLLWIAGSNDLFSWDGSRLVKYSTGEGSNRAPEGATKALLMESDGDMWFGTTKGVAMHHKNIGRFSSHKWWTDGKKKDHEVTAMFEDSDGRIWIGTQGDGLFKVDRLTAEFTRLKIPALSGSNTWIRAIHQENPGSILLGTEDGLFSVDTETMEVSHADNLGRIAIYCFCHDYEGGLWIGTYFKGAMYFSPQSRGIQSFSESRMGTSIKGNAISQFCEDSDGKIWVATEDSGLNLFDPKSGIFTSYQAGSGSGSLSSNNIHSLMLDGKHLWIGTFAKGIDIMDIHSGRVIKNYNTANSSLASNFIYSIIKASDGKIYAGGLSSLSVYDKTGHFSSIREFDNQFVYDLYEDNAGRIWIATKGSGVFRLSDGTLKHFQHNPEDSTSIGNRYIYRIFEDRKGRLWFAMEGGISCFKEETETFENHNGKQQITIYGILDDDNGDLYLSSNIGLIRYNPESHRSELYNQEDGLQSSQFNFRSSLSASDGKMYFGGLNGFSCFLPENLQKNKVAPKASISYVVLHTADSQENNITLKPDDRLTIGADVTAFDVHFDCLSYASPSRNRFSYRLIGLNDNWIVTDKSTVSFLDLPAGKYKLEMKAESNDSLWSRESCTLSLRIRAPWYSSITAKIIYTFLALLLVILFIHIWVRRRRAEMLLESEEKKMDIEKQAFQSKIQFFTNVAHDIKTPLTLIKAPLEIVMRDKEWNKRTEENLELIRQNTQRLTELVVQLLNFRRIDSDNYKLEFSRINIKAFIDGLVRCFNSNKKIKIVSVLPEQDLEWVADKQILTKIISNLLSNGVKYSRSTVIISAAIENTALKLRVSDDGPGIPEEEAEKIFDPFYRLSSTRDKPGFGIGLSLVKMLVEKHGGTIETGQNRELGGFEITISIPRMEVPHVPPFDIIETTEDFSDVAPSNCNLLIVEDDPEMLGFLLRTLGSVWSVTGAENGKKALEILKSNPIDIIISDITMPEMDGIELLQAIRQDITLCHIPIILLSSLKSIESKIEGLNFGADAYIEKPFSLGHIKATIDNILKNRQLLFERYSRMPQLEYAQENITHSESDWLEEVNNQIHKHLTDSMFTVDSLAQTLSMSHSALRRKLLKLTGMSPNNYIRFIRIQHAAKLLEEGKFRVNEVSYIVGINNQSYFARCFQKQYGVLPKDYKKK